MFFIQIGGIFPENPGVLGKITEKRRIFCLFAIWKIAADLCMISKNDS